MQQYEGKRVRGPNGEEGVIRNGQIVVLGSAPPPGAAAGGLELLVAKPEPAPAPQRPVDAALDAQQLENARLEAQAKRLAIAEAERKAADPAGGKAPGVEQGKAAGFYSRAAEANAAYEALNVGAESPGMAVARSFLPEGVTNLVAGGDRQAADANKRAFITSVLRYESGAAIPPDEFLSADKTYFPQVGDGPEAIAAKRAARLAALNGIGMGAGQAATPAPLDDAAYMAELDRLIRAGDRKAVDAFLAAQGTTADDPAQIEAAITAGAGRVMPPEAAQPSMGEQFLDSAGNTIAGLAQGAASIVDIPTNAMASVLGLGATALGMDGVAAGFRKPVTIGGMIEKVAPTPQDTVGRGVRFASELAGGAAAFPQRAANALANTVVGRVPPPPPGGNALAPRSQIGQDASDLGIDVLPAVTGGPMTRLLTAATVQTPGGARPIVQGASRMIDQSGAALRRIAGRAGNVENAESAGEAATRGALRYRDTSRIAASKLYDEAARVAEDVKVAPDKTVQALNKNIADLDAVPGGADGAKYLTELRDELVSKFSGGVTVQGVRGMRTQLRDRFFREGLRGSDIERRVNEAVDSVSDDLGESLTNAGKSQAAALYRQADKAWADRVKTIDDFLMPIIGKKGDKSGEQVFQALQQASKSNGPRLRNFLRSLPEEDAGTVRATMIDALGKARAGSQDAAGEAFTLDGFLTRWNELGPRARAALFSGESRQSIEKLARVAEQAKRAGGYANRSNTGGVVMMGATAGAGYAGFVPLMAALGAQYGAGRLLASPAVARLLARVGSAKSPREAQSAVKGLSAVAARNPALAEDIGGLQQRLAESFSGSPATAAAAEEQE